MEYHSKAGYIGGIVLFFSAFANYFLESAGIKIDFILLTRNDLLLSYILVSLVCMVIFEWRVRLAYNKTKKTIVSSNKNIIKSKLFLLKSAVYRFFSIFILFLLVYFIVNFHYYFQDPSFNITRIYYNYLLYLYILFGIPYIYITLLYRGDRKYEFNDYGILLLIAYKSLSSRIIVEKIYNLFTKNNSKKAKTIQYNFYKNRRIIKVGLVFLVNFFFLTLMTKFLLLEYNSFHFSMIKIFEGSFKFYTNLEKFHTCYQLIFHLLFYIDVGVAIIGYTVATRWLNNRTNSVDMTLYGWFVVLLCYPPMNNGFTEQFIAYGRFNTQPVFTSEIIQMILMCLILFSYSIYVWATLALGFKFSNLTNRGIISHGPYRYIRHPAYVSKNIAWWLDNSHVLSNFWAAIALLIWNIIYALRAITEEIHLNKDKNYTLYINQVKNRFIPDFFKIKIR